MGPFVSTQGIDRLEEVTMKAYCVLWGMVLTLSLAGLPGQAAEQVKLKDTESATHGYDAAYHQIVDTYEYPGFSVIQINLPVLSHYSYMLISDKQALVVDPDRDISAYLDLANEKELGIKGVLLTHSHADFIAGHIELLR